MAERKATNKYYPPEWTPEQGSLNTAQGHHPYGDRAKKIKQGILIIRFELPWDIWCSTCKELLPHGRRYNAEKQKAGDYLGISIFSFRFKCNKCANWIEIHTDPKNSDFIVASGASKKIETSETTNEPGLPVFLSAEEKDELNDAFARLEHSFDDKETADQQMPELESIREATERRYANSVANNRLLRSLHRVERKKAEKLVQEAESRGLVIPLLPEIIEDEIEAKTHFVKANSAPKHIVATQDSKKARTNASIFGTTSNPTRAKQAALLAKTQKRGVDLSVFRKKS